MSNSETLFAIDLESGLGISAKVDDEKPPPITPSSATLTGNSSSRSILNGWRKPSISHWFNTSPERQQASPERQRLDKPVGNESVSVERRRESIVRKLEECPAGFPMLACFLDSDENFMIYRRFGYLHARILLNKQDEIKEIEQELDEMDEVDNEDSEESRAGLKSRIDDESRTLPEGKKSRKALLREAEVLVKEYGQLLLQAQSLVAMNKPSNRDYTSVAGYLTHTTPLFQGEDDFIDRREDLVTLRPGRECAWLDAFVERVLKWLRCGPVTRMFSSADIRLKTKNPSLYYFSKDRISVLVTTLITLFILLLLVLPIYALYKLSSATGSSSLAAHSNAACIGVLIVATLVFSAILSLFTKARRHEILGASAAYCAVLVVFIGGVGYNGS